MRRFCSKIMAAVLLIGCIAGCFSGCNRTYLMDDRGIYTVVDGIKTYQLLVYDHGTSLPAGPPYRDQVLKEINDRLYERYGYHVEIVTNSFPDDSFFEKINVELAGGTSIDLVRQTHREVIVRNYRKGIAKDLSDYLADAPNLMATAEQKVWDEFTFEGGIYAIPLPDMPVLTTIWARGDMLVAIGYKDEEGNPKPPETLAELEDALIKIRDSGLLKGANTVPLATTLEDLETLLLGCFTDTPGDWLDEDGVIRNKYESEGYEEFLALVKRWYDLGLIDDQLFSGTSGASALLQRGAVGMYAGSVSDIQWGDLKGYHSANPEHQYCAIYPLTDSKKLESTGWAQEYLWIPYTSQSTQVMIEFLDFAYSSDENFDLVFYGIEGLTYVKGGEDGMEYDVPAEEIEYGANQPLDLMGMFIPGGGSYQKYLERVNRRTTSELAENTMTYYSQIPESQVYIAPTNYFPNVLDTILDDHQGNLQRTINGLIRTYLETEYTDSSLLEKDLETLVGETRETMATPKNGTTIYEELNKIYQNQQQDDRDYSIDIRNFWIMIGCVAGIVAIVIALFVCKSKNLLFWRNR